MNGPVPRSELDGRLRRFRSRMDARQPAWQLAAIFAKVNQYYFTGTMQEGLLLIPRDGEAVFWVRRSFERAREESLFPDIRPMKSFRDPRGDMKASAWTSIHVESEQVPLALVERFRKWFTCETIAGLDAELSGVRAVKSAYELAIMERVGAVHRRVLEESVPALLREGISEVEFACEVYSSMVRQGHEGIVRFNMLNADVAVGQFGFGENSLYPTSFNGPGGCRGISPAAPVLGCRDRKLRRGDLVFADIGCCAEGYSTDKTMIYAFAEPLPEEAMSAHRRCVEIQDALAARLKPGAIPSEIYREIMAGLDAEFLRNFMGFGHRRANFLGHGVGLHIDETPVLAEGFDEALVEGMVFALEPKKGMAGVGMVGIENTFAVTPAGGRSLTGQCAGPILVPA